jgi:hypothetical protein
MTAAFTAVVVLGSALLSACHGGPEPTAPLPPDAGSRAPSPTAGHSLDRPDLGRVVGHRGPTLPKNLESPTADKSQSKLWFQDGQWWALMYDDTTGSTEIYRLETKRQSWRTTGVVVDTRDHDRGDALWDGHKLYVVSSSTYSSGWGHPPTHAQVQAGSATLLRYTYLPREKTYRLDHGFPATIHAGSSESITLGKDSTGQLWVTYTRLGKVMVNRTTGADRSWGTPFALPGPAARVNSDDTSALVAFGGRQVGVLWSNQRARAFYFAVHDDRAADSVWRTEVAYGRHVGGCSRGCANDHVSVKALPDGRLFAAVKTANRRPGQPFIVLLVRDGSGWASHVVGTVEQLFTRPLVVLDDEKELLYLFTVVPEVGGAVYYKTTNVNSIKFHPGLGTPFLSGGRRINNPTSTKQPVGSRSGLVVLASDKSGKRYWHNQIPPS